MSLEQFFLPPREWCESKLNDNRKLERKMKSYLFFGVIFCVLLCGCKSLENDFEYFIQKYYQNNQLNAEDRHRLINILKNEKTLDTFTLILRWKKTNARRLQRISFCSRFINSEILT